MELEQYNIKAFQDGLEDILKNPWKKPVYIQDTIPTFPEESNDKDRTIHDLIKVMFVYKRLVCPYYSTVGHLCLNKSYFLKYVLETYSKKEEFSILFKGTSRLTSHQIYEAFYGMSPNNASFLLDRIDCPVSVYTKLKDALESREELKFAEAIDECDISNILPALKFVLSVKNQIKQLDGLGSQNNEEVDSEADSDVETEMQKMRYKAENEMTEKFDVSPSSKFNQENKTFIDELLRLMNNPNELLESFYPPLFCQYCQMKKGGGLNDSDIKAFEYIFHQTAFEEQYNECMKLWENGVLKDRYAKQPEENSPSEEVEGGEKKTVMANREETQTLQIEELTEEDVKVVPKKPQKIARETDEEIWRLQKYLSRKAHLDKKTKLPYCKGFKKSIVKAGDAGDRALTKFIQYLADNKYIDDDRITKNSFAYALTGRGDFRKMKIIKVEWHHKDSDTREVPESVRVLLYISSNLFDSEKGKTYSQLFDVLNAGPNPCIKGGKDQSPAYYDSVSEDFKEYFNECFGQFAKDFDKNIHKE